MSKPKFPFFSSVGLLPCLFLILHSTSALPTIDPQLKTFFEKNDQQSTDIIISMNESNSKPLEEATSRQFTSREERLNFISASLETFASQSQKNVLNFLNGKRVEMEQINKQGNYENTMKIQPLWISNQIIVRSADLSLIEELKNFQEIQSIDKDKMFQLLPSISTSIFPTSTHDNDYDYDNDARNQSDEDFPWGIQAIDAASVWKKGNRGKGIVVATIDTGVRVTHEALRDNYVGKGGWYDPSENTKEPNDQSGHGTHCTGTIAGTKRNIGVAPASKWMACKGCNDNSCSESDLSLCGQWILCPTEGGIGGNNNDKNCSRAPNVVSNSWGGGQNDPFYNSVIKAWRVAGIIPVFAIGNDGKGCGTAGSPGDQPLVIGVGATTINNTVASFSSRGPTADGRIKPDIAAPGAGVLSASASSDSGYTSKSGTSMSAPHVAGLVALLLAQNDKLDYEGVKKALCAGAGSVKSQGQTCGGIPDTKYPNNQVGCGQIHALRSVLSVEANYP